MKPTADSKHSPLGASSAERWCNCPGSVKLIEQCPPQEQSEYAREGQAAHALGEKILKMKNPIHADNFIGEEFEGVKVTSEMAEAVQIYVEHVREQMKAAGPGAKLFVEQAFNLNHIDKRLWGTNDACVVEPFGRLFVDDFKYGAGHKVVVKDNMQLLYYALGAVRNLDLDVSEVVICIIQPRTSSGKGITQVTVTRDELREFEIKLQLKVMRVDKKDAPLVAGAHCKFCPAKPLCPMIRKEIETKAIAEFTKNPLTPPEPQRLTKEQLIKVLSYADMVDDWIASVRKYCQEQAEHGEKFAGFKLVAKRAIRSWENPQAAEEFFQGKLGKAAYSKPEFLSPAQIEKVLGGKKGKEEVELFTIKQSSGVVLVEESDARPEVTEAVTDFNEPKTITNFPS